MPSEPESPDEFRPLPEARSTEASAAAFVPREPLFQDQGSRRSSNLVRVLIAVVAAPLIAAAGYAALVAPQDDERAWTPPSGLSADQTPHWLQTLCADRTPELCAAAERARNTADCDAMRAALRSLEAVERKLSARGAVSSKQRWVLIDLYGQGHELCQFERAQPPGAAK